MSDLITLVLVYTSTRDQRRKEQFLEKKMATAASADVKKENSENGNVAEATFKVPIDEIDLIKIPDNSGTETLECDLFKIKGEYKTLN